MKKIVLLIMTLCLLVGCTPLEEKKDSYMDWAINYAVAYLNQVHGYDASLKYKLTCNLKDNQTLFPRHYQLYENEEMILSYIIDDDMGEWYRIIDDKQVSISRDIGAVDTSVLTYVANELAINDDLYLENVEKIDINLTYTPTPEDKYELVKAALHFTAEVGDGINPIHVCVYDYLNIIDFGYNPETKTLMASESQYLNYPVVINDKCYVAIIKRDTYEPYMFMEYRTDGIIDFLQKNESFVVLAVSSIYFPKKELAISASGENIIEAPVIAKLTFAEVQKLAAEQSAYKLILDFETMDYPQNQPYTESK